MLDPRALRVLPAIISTLESSVTPAPESGDKLTRFGPFSSQCRAGNVKIRRGAWNEELFRVLEGSPISPMTTRSTPAAEPWKCSTRK